MIVKYTGPVGRYLTYTGELPCCAYGHYHESNIPESGVAFDARYTLLAGQPRLAVVTINDHEPDFEIRTINFIRTIESFGHIVAGVPFELRQRMLKHVNLPSSRKSFQEVERSIHSVTPI